MPECLRGLRRITGPHRCAYSGPHVVSDGTPYGDADGIAHSESDLVAHHVADSVADRISHRISHHFAVHIADNVIADSFTDALAVGLANAVAECFPDGQPDLAAVSRPNARANRDPNGFADDSRVLWGAGPRWVRHFVFDDSSRCARGSVHCAPLGNGESLPSALS